MGAEILENYLEIKGWEVVSMGHIAPEEDILEVNSAIQTRRHSCLGYFNRPSSRGKIAAARRSGSLAPGCKIVVGGPAAVLAREALLPFSDAVVRTFEEAHTRSLHLLGSHA